MAVNLLPRHPSAYLLYLYYFTYKFSKYLMNFPNNTLGGGIVDSKYIGTD